MCGVRQAVLILTVWGQNPSVEHVYLVIAWSAQHVALDYGPTGVTGAIAEEG